MTGSSSTMRQPKLMKRLTSLACTALVLFSAAACLFQFKGDDLVPLALGCLSLFPVWWLRPAWRPWTPIIPLLCFAVLLVDAFALRHRLTMQAKIWNPIWQIGVIQEVYVSPSGRTTVYLVGQHWLDSSYSLYLSAGSLFPRRIDVGSDEPNLRYQDLVGSWKGPFFTFGAGRIWAAFDERNGSLYSYDDWHFYRGPRTFNEPPRTHEAFSQYIETIRPKD